MVAVAGRLRASRFLVMVSPGRLTCIQPPPSRNSVDRGMQMFPVAAEKTLDSERAIAVG